MTEPAAHPFRFGVQLSDAATGARWREKARKLEALGYSTLLVPDHLDQQWGPLVALTVAAEATSTLRVGSLVLSNDLRHPVVLAKELATLDLASGGRLEVGLGAGWLRRDYETLGIPYDRPAVRIERMAESLEVIKELWSSLTVTHAGPHYDVRVSHGLPRPAQRPHPPILVGGGGRKILSFAAQHADIVGINARLSTGRLDADFVASTSPEAFRQRVGWVREAAGERFEQLELQAMALLCRVTDDRGAALELLAQLLNHSPAELDACPLVLAGTIEQLCETLIARREQYGLSYWVIREQELEMFAPVVDRLAGR